MFPLRGSLVTTGSCLIASQNGVAGTRPLHSELSKRPARLDVGSSSSFPAKAFQEDSEEIDEGSLPCTPELLSDENVDASACATAHDAALDSDTRQLVSRFLRDYTGLSRPQWSQGKPLTTMKRVVADLVEKHRYVYNGMITKLALDDKGDDVSFVRAVAQSLFADGVTNWGRVASLMAFGAVVCQHLKDNHRGSCVDQVGEEIASYLLSEQREWLLKNNAWNGFVEFFRAKDTETAMMKSLVAVAGVAGIGATLAMFIR